MSELEEIREEADWKRCLEQFDYFHDSILRETYLVSKGYVMRDRRMFDDATCDARLIFHSQDERSPVLEMVLEGVTEFRIAAKVDLEPIMKFSGDTIELALGGDAERASSMIVARSARYRLLGSEVLGEKLIIGSPIEAEPANG